MSTHNPYAPPVAGVTDPIEEAASLHARMVPPRNRPAGHAWRWFADSWRLYKRHPVAWWIPIGLISLLIVIDAVIGIWVPLTEIAFNAVFPVFTAGVGACTRTVLEGEKLRPGQVFDGFHQRLQDLLVLGLLSAVGQVLAHIVALAAFGGVSMLPALLGFHASGPHPFDALGAGFFALDMAITCALLVALAHAPYLVHEYSVSPWKAIGLSFQGLFLNIPATLVCCLLAPVFALIASIPLFLGWFALWPVFFLSGYIAFRDIYTENRLSGTE